jgi:hypothetical protein
MNEFLADMYNTRENIGAAGSADDIEKLAEAQILSDELAAEGYDASELPPDALLKVAYELWGDDSAIVKAAAEEEGEEDEDEGEEDEGDEEDGEKQAFEEKLAEADFLGRVMAHSFVDEQAALEKEASAKETAAKAGKYLKDAPYRAVQALKRKGRSMKGSYEGGTALMPSGGRSGAWIPRDKPSRLGGAWTVAKEHPKTVGGAALAAGGAGYGGKKLYDKATGKKKKGSALDALAEERALEMLKEAGYEQQPSLEEAVEQRALEMLAEAGY